MNINLKGKHILLNPIQDTTNNMQGGIIVAGGSKINKDFKEGIIQISGKEVSGLYCKDTKIGYDVRNSREITILGKEYIIINEDSIIYSL